MKILWLMTNSYRKTFQQAVVLVASLALATPAFSQANSPYRLYQKEVARIGRSGGSPVRVLFDYELKRNLNRDLALLGPEKDDADRRSQVAEKHHLQVVNGKIPVPDLRVEYETPELELRHVDLELATRDYRPRAMAAKAAAGFSMYSRSEDASRLRRVLDEREITARILTL
jgi:hypothetical protein